LSKYVGYLYFAPAIILIVVLKVYPLLSGFYYSFTNWRGGPTYDFVGIDNYVRMTQDPAFVAAMGNALKVLITLPIWVFVPFVLAFLIFQRLPGSSFFRAAFFFSYTVAPVMAGYIFSFVLGLDGPVNEILRAIGLDAIAVQWFGTKATSLWALVLVALWSFFGLGVIIYLAGMANIPHDYFDAAVVDGANWLQSMWFVGLPSILPTVGYWAVICTAGMLIWFFPYIYAITQGGPGYASMLPEYYIYQVSTRYAEPGYATALGMVLFLYILIVSFFQIRYMYFDSSERTDK
jgi:multiple sugar transport system permease protein/raffinose/stachyose/melibiose transport system permease protein